MQRGLHKIQTKVVKIIVWVRTDQPLCSFERTFQLVWVILTSKDCTILVSIKAKKKQVVVKLSIMWA